MEKFQEIEVPVLAPSNVWTEKMDPFLLDGWREDRKWYKDDDEDVFVIRFKKYFPKEK